jgi:outer membrane protein assembly factor BamB
LNPDDTQQWYFQTKKWIDSSPAVSKEENVYFGSNDGSLYALSSGGILLWTFTTNGVITTTPAIDSDGTFLWSFTTGGIVRSSPTLGSDVALYLGSSDGNRYATGEQ